MAEEIEDSESLAELKKIEEEAIENQLWDKFQVREDRIILKEIEQVDEHYKPIPSHFRQNKPDNKYRVGEIYLFHHPRFVNLYLVGKMVNKNSKEVLDRIKQSNEKLNVLDNNEENIVLVELYGDKAQYFQNLNKYIKFDTRYKGQTAIEFDEDSIQIKREIIMNKECLQEKYSGLFNEGVKLAKQEFVSDIIISDTTNANNFLEIAKVNNNTIEDYQLTYQVNNNNSHNNDNIISDNYIADMLE